MGPPIEHPFRSRTLMADQRLGHGLLERLALEAAGDQVAVGPIRKVGYGGCPAGVVEDDRIGPAGSRRTKLAAKSILSLALMMRLDVRRSHCRRLRPSIANRSSRTNRSWILLRVGSSWRPWTG